MIESQLTHDWVLLSASLALLVAAVSDMKSLRIPNECSLLLLVLYPMHVLLSPVDVTVLSSLAIFIAVFIASYTVHRIGRFGGGDVKLLSVVSLWAGSEAIGPFLIVTSLIGGIMAILYVSHLKWSMVVALNWAGQTDIADHIIQDRLPYGVAIAGGGLFLLSTLSNVG